MKKIAIEVKRYAENQKITFSKVTSFLGANVANSKDLVYVTTSSYTRPAEDFAKEQVELRVVDSFELKQRRDVLAWAQEQKSQMLVEYGE